MFKYKIDQEIELKLIDQRDAEVLFKLTDQHRDYLRKWLPWVDQTTSVEDTKGFVKMAMNQWMNNNGFQALIEYQGETVGIVGLHEYSALHKKTSIGYWVAEDAQGHGIMTRAVKGLIQMLFNDYDINRIEIRCAEGNEKSQQIPKRLGFKEEGVLRCAENLYGDFVNHKVYGMLKEDWLIK